MSELSEYQVSGLRLYTQSFLRAAEGKLEILRKTTKQKIHPIESEIFRAKQINRQIAKYYTNMVNLNYTVSLQALHTPSNTVRTFEAIGLRHTVSYFDQQIMIDQDHYDFLERELSRIDGNSFNSSGYDDPHGIGRFSQMFLGMLDNFELVPVVVNGVERPFKYDYHITSVVPTTDVNMFNVEFKDRREVENLLKRIRIDAAEAPQISGFKAVESGPFGCCVNFLSSITAKSTARDIFERMSKPYEFAYDFDFESHAPQISDGYLDDMIHLPLFPGFSVYDLERYIEAYDNENVYHLYFMNNNKVTLNLKKFNESCRPRSAIEILVHNNHIYVPNEKTECFKLKNVSRGIVYDETISLEEGECAPHWKLFNAVDRTTLLDFGHHNGSRDFLAFCYFEKNFLPVVKMRHGGISEIVVNSHTIVVSEQIELRRQFIAKLYQEFPACNSFKAFKNQSWTQIACSLAEQSVVIGDYRSYDSLTDRETLNQFKTAHVMGLYDVINDGNNNTPVSVDLNKCYLNIMLSSGDRSIGCFNSTDNFCTIENSNETIENNCEYIVDKFEYCNVPVKAQCWNGHSVLKLLELGAIDRSMIKQVRRPSKVISLARIVNMLKSWQQKYPEVLKYLYTQWIGYCGIGEDKKYNSYLTTDTDEYNGRRDYLTGCEIPHSLTSLKCDKKLYLMYSTSKTQQLQSINPLYRYVVGEGIVKLLDLARLTFDHGYKTIATRVDCCYLQPMEIHSSLDVLEAAVKSFAKLQTKRCGLTTVQEVFESYSNIIEKRLAIDGILITESKGKIINGPAGSGKTTEAIRIANSKPKQTVLCMAVMRKVVAKLKSEVRDQKYNNFAQMECFQQWNTDFSCVRPKANGYYKSMINSVKTIIIDEFSMMGAREYNILHRLCYDILLTQGDYPDVVMVGDNLQINPVKQATIDCKDLVARKVFPYLSEYIEKPYLAESGRYNYYSVVKEFLETKKLPQAFLDRVFNSDAIDRMPLSINIAAHNKVRLNVIRLKQAILPDDNVIITRSSKGKFSAVSAGKSEALIYDNGEIMSRQEAIDRKIPESDFESAFCFTSHKSQGGTFEVPYGIYELENMSLQQAYVSLTRGRRLDQIFIAGDRDALASKTFKLHDYTSINGISSISKTDAADAEPEMFPIYLYRNDVNKSIYIGKTIRTIETRAAEHAESDRALEPELFKLLCSCQEQDLLTIESNLIREYCGHIVDSMHELFGYEILNKQHVITVSSVPKSTQPMPALIEDGEPSSFYARQDALNIRRIEITEDKKCFKCIVNRKSMRIKRKSADLSQASLLTLIETVKNDIRKHYPTF